MGLMIDVLNKRIKDMKELRQREARRDNKAAQDALDHQFETLTSQIHSMMGALKFAKENMQFQLSEQTISELNSLLTVHKGVIRSGTAEKDALSQAENGYKSIQQSIKKEWSKRYTMLTYSTTSTLQVISGIDSDRVAKCLEGIVKGASWTTSIGDFKTMNQSLAEAKTLIDSLGLDEKVILFLQKMNSGKATVVDLNDDVLRWLKTESLDKRVSLTFAAGNRK